jgi:uncharacterized membrane protein
MYRGLNYLERFIVYGCLGLCVEIVFTSIGSLIYDNNLILKGYTYLWMIPVWAAGLFALGCVHKYIRNLNILARGLIYMLVCIAVEYLSGIYFLATLKEIPWDYSYSEYNIHGAIRLDYLPFWFIAGILSEKAISYINKIKINE